MMHNSSGRNNFGYVRPSYKTQQQSSEQQISGDQASKIQQQTSEAIKVATQSDNVTDNTNKNPK